MTVFVEVLTAVLACPCGAAEGGHKIHSFWNCQIHLMLDQSWALLGVMETLKSLALGMQCLHSIMGVPFSDDQTL
jgi:hypothetical protein